MNSTEISGSKRMKIVHTEYINLHQAEKLELLLVWNYWNVYRQCYSYIRQFSLLFLPLFSFRVFSFLWFFFPLLLAHNFLNFVSSLFASSPFSCSSTPGPFSLPLPFCLFVAFAQFLISLLCAFILSHHLLLPYNYISV